MPIVQVELIGRTADSRSITRNYYLHGPADEVEVYASLSSLPEVLADLPRLDFRAEEEAEIAGDWRATVIWAAGPQPLNTADYRFNYTMPSAHISQSLETIAASPKFDDIHLETRAPNFRGAINVVMDGGKHRVEGLDLAPPPETFTIAFASETDVVTREYQMIVEDLCGKVNDNTFYLRPAGTILLTRVSGGVQYTTQTGVPPVWQIEYGFSYIANNEEAIVIRKNDPGQPSGADNFEISFDPGVKEGHDLLWVYYDAKDDSNSSLVVQQPRAAYIERIYQRGDFGTLMLPGSEEEEEEA